MHAHTTMTNFDFKNVYLVSEPFVTHMTLFFRDLLGKTRPHIMAQDGTGRH